MSEEYKSVEFLPEVFGKTEVSEVVTDLIDHVMKTTEKILEGYEIEDIQLLFYSYNDLEAAYAYFNSIFKNSIGTRTVIELICKLYSNYYSEFGLSIESSNIVEWFESLIPLPPYKFNITVNRVLAVEAFDNLVRAVYKFKNERSFLASVRMPDCSSMVVLDYSELDVDFLSDLEGKVRIIDGYEIVFCFFRPFSDTASFYGFDHHEVITRSEIGLCYISTFLVLDFDFFDNKDYLFTNYEIITKHQTYTEYIYPLRITDYEGWEKCNFSTWYPPKKRWNSSGQPKVKSTLVKTYQNQIILSDSFYPVYLEYENYLSWLNLGNSIIGDSFLIADNNNNIKVVFKGLGDAGIDEEDGLYVYDDLTKTIYPFKYDSERGYNRPEGVFFGIFDTPFEYGLSEGNGFVLNQSHLYPLHYTFYLDNDAEEGGLDNVPIDTVREKWLFNHYTLWKRNSVSLGIFEINNAYRKKRFRVLTLQELMNIENSYGVGNLEIGDNFMVGFTYMNYKIGTTIENILNYEEL